MNAKGLSMDVESVRGHECSRLEEAHRPSFILHPSSFILLVLAAAGCASERSPLVAGEPALPVASRSDPDPLSVSRLQKPDNESSPKPMGELTLTSANNVFHGPADGQLSVRIRAQVNGLPIFDDEVREATYQYLVMTVNLPEPERTQRQREIYERELDKLIEREMILSEALGKLKTLRPQYLEKLSEAAKKEFDKQVRSMKSRAAESGLVIKTDEEFKALLRQQGLTLEGIKRQIERSFMAMEYMRSRIFPEIERLGFPQLQEYYDEHPGEFQIEDRVVWQDIFIDASKFPDHEAARRFALQVLAQAQKGVNFLELSKKYDNGDSSYRNGEGYGQRRGEIKPPEAEPILFQLKEGELGPLIEWSSGFHVIRLVKRDYAGARPLDDKTQAEIRKKLQNLIADREFKRIVADLRRVAKIERDDAP